MSGLCGALLRRQGFGDGIDHRIVVDHRALAHGENLRAAPMLVIEIDTPDVSRMAVGNVPIFLRVDGRIGSGWDRSHVSNGSLAGFPTRLLSALLPQVCGNQPSVSAAPYPAPRYLVAPTESRDTRSGRLLYRPERVISNGTPQRAQGF
jgi:hypothetical protein